MSSSYLYQSYCYPRTQTSTMAANQDGGYHCRFVEQPKELQAECIICLCILREPQIVNCCGIKFCQVCINAIVVQNRPCPHCQARQFTTMADKQLKRQLEDRKVFCSNEQRGCKWKGELKKLGTHLDEKINQNIYSVTSCQFQDVPCPRCQQQVQRKGLQSHIKNVCQQRDVPCIYEYAGCKTKVRQNLMEAHLQNRALDHARYLSEHSQQLANDVRVANGAIQALRGEVDTLRKGNLEKIEKLEKKSEKQLKELKTAVDFATFSAFSVRGLLIVITLVILVCTWWYVYTHQDSTTLTNENMIFSVVFGGILIWLFLPNLFLYL
ncbi:TNF receptor-associated factor 3-like [Halichondria panicea]|uniref:TNF receptor-associated factor 3-like n=1 Tax=Halichondria panicea TaxID=6063 RepID=UPI00312B330E